jgi:hypothetical protein
MQSEKCAKCNMPEDVRMNGCLGCCSVDEPDPSEWGPEVPEGY